MDLKDIKAIIDLMKKNSLTELELENPELKIKLKRSSNGVSAPTYEETIAYAAPAAAPAAGSPAAPQPAAASGLEIKSPMVGTFYRAPSPEAANYVEVGSEVKPDTVVCIVEAMKVMNEIKAEVHGVVTQALLENAKPVEFGQPLFRIRPL